MKNLILFLFTATLFSCESTEIEESSNLTSILETDLNSSINSRDSAGVVVYTNDIDCCGVKIFYTTTSGSETSYKLRSQGSEDGKFLNVQTWKDSKGKKRATIKSAVIYEDNTTGSLKTYYPYIKKSGTTYVKVN